ncbi:MAG: TetR/AcrR family transcriptional regulator, partial [Gammaproteobacteria bacterium]
ILDAAARMFRDKGYVDVRLSDIAAAAGMQTGSLYYHFASRDELVEQILKDGVDSVFAATAARVGALPPGATPREKFACAIRAHLEAMHAVDDYVAASIRMINQVPKALVAARREWRRAYLDYWRNLFAEAEAAGVIRDGVNVSVCRMLLMGLLNWSIEWFRKDGLSATEVAEQASRLLMDGIMLPAVTAASPVSGRKTSATTAKVQAHRVKRAPTGAKTARTKHERQASKSRGKIPKKVE